MQKILTRPPQPTPTTPTLDDVIAHLNTVNQPCTKHIATESDQVPGDQATESYHSSPSSSPGTSRSRESVPEESTEDTASLDDSQSTTSDSSLPSTTSDRQLRPRYPISYNEKLLSRLNRILQVRALNNLLIPIPASDSDFGRHFRRGRKP